MVNKYVGAGQAVFNLGKKVIQKLSGQGKTTGTEVIKSVKPNPQTSDSIHKITMAKIPGQVQRKGMPIMRDLEKTGTALRRINQKLEGQKITKSGFTKGKDLKVEKKAKGGRIGYKRGTGLKRKSNVEKIKETFSPKNKIKFDAKKSDLDKSGDLSKYEKARGMAIAKAMAKRKNKKVI